MRAREDDPSPSRLHPAATVSLPARVLVLTNMWPSRATPSAGIFVKEQVEALRAGAPSMQVDVLTIDRTRSRLQYALAVPRLRRQLDRGYDLLHAHYGLTAAVAVTQTRCPVVATFHGSDLYLDWQRGVSRLAARRTGANICVSERLAGALGRADTNVIPCGVDLALFRPDNRARARDELGLPQDRRLVLFPGHPANPVKNYPLFVSTLAALPPPLRDQVEPVLLTQVPRERVPLYLAAVDAVLLTSRYEGANMVVKEALACERPVVSVPVGDIPETIAGVPGCALAPAEPGALAHALASTLRHGGGQGGRRRLEQLGQDAEWVAERVLAVYRGVMEARPPGTRRAGSERASGGSNHLAGR